MFAKVKDILAGLTQHSEKNQLAAVEAELARGWSFAAFDKLQQLAENNNVSAQYRLGQMYERAEGVVQNLPDAVQWYRRAAERGHALSQARLGLIHFLDPLSPAALTADDFERFGSEPRSGTVLRESFPNGFIVETDYVQAAQWNRLAAEAGVAEAQARYGLQLANGLGLDRNLAEAERWFSAAAVQGETAGQLGLGILYAGGYGAPSDFPRAIEWLTKAAAAGNSAAHYWIGSLLLRGEGVDRGAEEGVEHLQAAADQGNLDAGYLLAIALWQGEYVAADFSRAEALLRRAALRGHVEAAFALGEILLERQDDEGLEGAKWLREAAEAGHKRAAAVLGELCLSGRGLPRDPSAAARWLEIGKEESRPDAFISLAFLYAEGIGVDRDYEAAATWLRLAAERGSTAAQFNLGSFYRFALGVPRDDEEAVQRYRIAAEKGSAEAAFQLGLLYAEPDGELHDYEKAAAWFSRASQAGHDLASCNLAFLLIEGKGIESDPARSLELLEAAAANGSVAAAEALVGLYSSGRHFPHSPEKAVRLLAEALKLGSPAAAIAIADLHEEGDVVPVDRQRGIARLEKAAAEGDIGSKVALGRLLAAGVDGVPDFPAAQFWFAQAAEEGDPFAQAWMGDCCRLGLVGPSDWQSAEAWYCKAAAQNHVGSILLLADALSSTKPHTQETLSEIFGLWLAAASNGNGLAQRNVGICYLHGRGCPEDPIAAVQWLMAAAEQEDAEAEYELGCCYRQGRGVEKDLAEARVWLKRAEDHGYNRRAIRNASPRNLSGSDARSRPVATQDGTMESKNLQAESLPRVIDTAGLCDLEMALNVGDVRQIAHELAWLFPDKAKSGKLRKLAQFAVDDAEPPLTRDRKERVFLECITETKRLLRGGSMRPMSHRSIGQELDFVADCEGVEGWSAAQCLSNLLLRQIKPRRKSVVVSSMRNDGIYILDWIAHYNVLGFDHTIIYTNDNSDCSEDILRLLAEHGVITLIESDITGTVPPERKAYGHAVQILHELRDFEWAMFLDSDEYFIPGAQYGNSVVNVLSAVERQFPEKLPSGICYHWLWFISGMAFARMPGPLIERFQHARPHRLTKCIARVSDLVSMRCDHYPEVKDGGIVVDSVFDPLDMDSIFDAAPRYGGGRVNHYWTRSFEEFAIKKARGATLKLSENQYDRPLSSFFAWNGFETPDNHYPPDMTFLRNVKSRIEELKALEGVRAASEKIERNFPEFVRRIAGGDLRKLYEESRTDVTEL